MSVAPTPCSQIPVSIKVAYAGTLSGWTEQHGPCVAGEPIHFTAVSLVDLSTCPFVGYGWNFGDGTPAGGKTIDHAFTGAGSYNVSLTVVVAANQATVVQPVSVAESVPLFGFASTFALLALLVLIACLRRA